MKIFQIGKGKGTYAVAVVTILWAVWGWWQGSLDPVTAQQAVVASLAVMGFRRALNK